MQEFKVNDFIVLRFEGENTVIYIAGKEFLQCKILLFNVAIDKVNEFNEISSIDEAVEVYNPSTGVVIDIPPEVRFWAHCSNLQTWAENNYNPRILHSSLSFPLLRKLSDAGNKQALQVFKEEIAGRIGSGNLTVVQYLWNQGFFKYLTKEELSSIEFFNNSELRVILELEDIINREFYWAKDYYDGEVEQVWFSMKEGKIIDLEISFTPELEAIPDIITNLKSLKSLILHEDLLSFLPVSIGNMVSLGWIHLSNNQIATIPNTIKNCKNLKKIELSGNILRVIHKSIGNLSLLEELKLSYNRLSQLPSSIGKLRSLRDLDLGFNYLETLPDSIRNLESLENLNLMYNKLTQIPDSLTNLSSLKSLRINENNLKIIPENIKNLRNLKSLQVDYQQAENMKMLIPELEKNGINVYKVKTSQRLLNLHVDQYKK